MSMQPQNQDKNSLIKQALSHVSDQLSASGHKNIYLNFVGVEKLNPPARGGHLTDVFKIECKQYGRMTGVAPKKLGNIFVGEAMGTFYSCGTSSDHITSKEFDDKSFQEFTREDAIKDPLEELANITL